MSNDSNIKEFLSVRQKFEAEKKRSYEIEKNAIESLIANKKYMRELKNSPDSRFKKFIFTYIKSSKITNTLNSRMNPKQRKKHSKYSRFGSSVPKSVLTPQEKGKLRELERELKQIKRENIKNSLLAKSRKVPVIDPSFKYLDEEVEKEILYKLYKKKNSRIQLILKKRIYLIF